MIVIVALPNLAKVAAIYRLPLIGTRSTAIPIVIVPVGTTPGSAFAFPIVATADPIVAVTITAAAMAIPVAAVHVVIVSFAVVASLLFVVILGVGRVLYG